MKSLTRTIIVLAVFNLVIGNFALAQNASNEPDRPRLSRQGVPIPPETALPEPHPVPTPVEPTPPTSSGPGGVTISGNTGLSGVMMAGLPGKPFTDKNGYYTGKVPYGWRGRIMPVKEGYTFKPVYMTYGTTKSRKTEQNYFPTKVGPTPIFARTGSRKVLVIPATDVEAENLVAITEDLQVMSHIFDEKFKEPREIKGVFVDFGDFFGRNSRSTEAIYIQGYGALFLMEVNFAFSPPPEPQEQEAKETEEYVDPDWQRAKQKLFSPQGFGGSDFVPEEKYSADKIDQIKTELIRTLKHAANIRNLKPDEWVILTVIGQGRQPGEIQFDRYYRLRNVDSRSRTSTFGQSSSSLGGGYSVAGGYASSSVGGYGDMDGYGGGMEYGEIGPPSATVLTIRAKKSDVDAFAKGELDFEQFQQKVLIFMY